MTTKILDALKENKPKFLAIESLSKEIEEVIRQKEEAMNGILSLHQIVFKNFSTERKETPVKIKENFGDNNDNTHVYINKDGISLKRGYATNTDYLGKGNISSFVYCLNQIKIKELEILPHITKPKKQEIFTQFLEHIILLKCENEMKKKLESEMIYSDVDGQIYKIMQVKVNPRHISLDYSGSWTWGKERGIGLYNLDIRDKVIIEQIYDGLKLVLVEYLNIEKTNLNNSKFVLEDLKKKFSKQLILNSLNKKKNEGVK